MSVTLVKVVSKKPGRQSHRDFLMMFAEFKKQCDRYGVKQLCKQKKHFESKAEKRRRKRRQAELECKKMAKYSNR